MIDYDPYLPDEPPKKLRGDEDYELVKDVQLEEDMIAHQACFLCQRKDGNIIGPFVRGKSPDQNQTHFYFHQDCLEANNTTFYNQQKHKWMNIGKALEIQEKKPSMCDRCGKLGATVKCKDCRKTYHGYFCSTLYMIFIQQQTYQCFECRNRDNYHKQVEGQLEKQEIKMIKRTINRDYLLSDRQVSQIYVPQVGDEVYYFFQGHEQFIHAYNCFFYCGDDKKLEFEFPWVNNHKLLKATLCKIVDIEYRFPSNKALGLLKLYGKSMEPPQIPEIITNLKFQIVGEDSLFSMDYFPNSLPEFFITKHRFEDSYNNYNRLQRSGQLLDQVVKKKGKEGPKYRIIGIKSFEEIIYPESQWMTLQCKVEDQYRLRERGRRGAVRREDDELVQIESLNFWDLDLPNDQINSIAMQESLENSVKEIAINVIADTVEKKKDIADPFIRRVSESVAKDYRDHIAAEMFIQLIQTRLLNNYYRHIEQLYRDLDQIQINCEIYNTDEHPLTQEAKKLIKAIKQGLNSNLPLINSEKSKKLEEPSSSKVMQKSDVLINSTKITIPMNVAGGSRNGRSAGKMSVVPNGSSNDYSMDAFKRELEETNSKPSDNKIRIYQEEEKTLIDTSFVNQNLISSNSRSRQNAPPLPSTSIFKTTHMMQMDGPKQEGQESKGRRRLTRLQNAKENTLEETTYQPVLGKLTRSGRRTQRKSLQDNNGDEDYQSGSEFEEDDFDNDEEVPVTTTASRKRLRRI